MVLKKKKYIMTLQKKESIKLKIEDNYLDTIENNKSKPRIPFGSLS